MNYYRYDTNCNVYQMLHCVDDDYELLKSSFRENSRLSSNWKSIQFTPPEFQEDNKEGDFVTFTGYGKIPIMSDRARRAIESLLDERYEFLEGRHPNGYPLWILHMMEEVDCLDKGRVEGSWNGMDRFTWIHKFAFHFDKIGNRHIFRLPLHSAAVVLVDDVFRETVEKHKLTGLHFKPLPMVD